MTLNRELRVPRVAPGLHTKKEEKRRKVIIWKIPRSQTPTPLSATQKFQPRSLRPKTLLQNFCHIWHPQFKAPSSIPEAGKVDVLATWLAAGIFPSISRQRPAHLPSAGPSSIHLDLEWDPPMLPTGLPMSRQLGLYGLRCLRGSILTPGTRF